MVVPRSVRKQRSNRSYLIGTVGFMRAKMEMEHADEMHRRELDFLKEKLKFLTQIMEQQIKVEAKTPA